MAFTTDQLAALDEAISGGVLTVEYADKKVTYRSLDDMLRLRNAMNLELNPGQTSGARKYAQFSNGLLPNTNCNDNRNW